MGIPWFVVWLRYWWEASGMLLFHYMVKVVLP